MNKQTNRVPRAGPLVALKLGTLLALISGCGDAQVYKTNPGDIDPSSFPTDHACFVGSTIELTRHSSDCATPSTTIASNVQDGVVFSGDQTRSLESPCNEGPSPGFELIFHEDTHSIFFDFSQVRERGRFPESDFEGYVLRVEIVEDNGYLLGVAVDDDLSTLAVEANDLEWDRDFIEVNLAGVAYDERGMLRLELVFARVSPVPG